MYIAACAFVLAPQIHVKRRLAVLVTTDITYLIYVQFMLYVWFGMLSPAMFSRLSITAVYWVAPVDGVVFVCDIGICAGVPCCVMLLWWKVLVRCVM